MKKVFLILALMFLAGCATPKEKAYYGTDPTEERFYIRGPEITIQQIEIIKVVMKENLVKIGMTKDDIKELFGEPQAKSRGYRKGRVIYNPKSEDWEWGYIDRKKIFFRAVFLDDKAIQYWWWTPGGRAFIKIK